MNIQAGFDLETAEDVLAPQIKKICALRGGMRAILNRGCRVSCSPCSFRPKHVPLIQ